MHYYRRNLGDYAKKTGRLSMLQHGAYTLLIDACYDRERFPTLDEAIEWTWASTKEELEAVEFVLRRFFALEDGVYVQKRIQEEIAEYREKSKKNQRIAMEREANRKKKTASGAPVVHGSSPDGHEAPPNHKPLTTNQEPIKNPSSTAAQSDEDAGEALNPSKSAPEDPEFEAAWAAYPKRIGGNPKRDALRAWRARVKEGVPAEVMHAGVERYAAHLKATGKSGTEYVMQAQRFFGPSQPFNEPWHAPTKQGGFVHDLTTMDYTRGVDENGNF